MSEQDAPKKYSKEFFEEPFPANHNALIGSMQSDTLNNVRDALYAIRDVVGTYNDFTPSTRSTSGVIYLMTCTLDAIEFELNHRD